MKSKILLTAIFKDDSEIEEVKRMLSSFMPHMAGLAVAITGLSKKHSKLIKLIEKYNGKYVITSPETHPGIYAKDKDGYFFANFAEARNASFDLADTLEGYDWYSWADSDDVLVEGQELDACATKAVELGVDTVFFTYWYSVKLAPDGTFTQYDVEIDHLRERLIKPKMFKWVSNVHEVAVPKDGNYKANNTVYDFNPKEGRECVWAHLTTSKQSEEHLHRNLRILEQQARQEQHKDPRTLFYLAKTYFDMHQKDKDELALFLLQDYLQMSGWAEERANAWDYIGNIYSRLGNHDRAIEAFYSGIKEYPDRMMAYLLLAKELDVIGQHENSSFWLNMALRMDDPKTRTTIGNPLERKYLASSLKYNEAVRKQDIKEALYWLKIRNKLVGITDDKQEITLQDLLTLNDACTWVFNYAKWLNDRGHSDKVKSLLESVPHEMGQEPFVSFIANEIKEPKIWAKNSIVYYASWGATHFEKWSAKSLGSGIGGSETAVIELAKRWAKMGYDVTVFGDPREDAGVYEGVNYRPWYEINWKDTFNTIILWRAPHLLDKDIKASKIFYDAHDVESNLNWTAQRVQKIDRVFFKSDYHRNMVPALHEGKVAVVSNGI